jgi:hypothetical protein
MENSSGEVGRVMVVTALSMLTLLGIITAHVLPDVPGDLQQSSYQRSRLGHGASGLGARR